MNSKEIVNKIKPYSKKGLISLYKAYLLNNDDEMFVDSDITVMSLTKDMAVANLFCENCVTDVGITNSQLAQKEIQQLVLDKWEQVCPYGTIISILKLTFDEDEILLKDIVNGADSVFSNESITITLEGKFYSMSVKDYILEDIIFEVDKDTEIKTVHNVKLRKIDDNKD